MAPFTELGRFEARQPLLSPDLFGSGDGLLSRLPAQTKWQDHAGLPGVQFLYTLYRVTPRGRGGSIADSEVRRRSFIFINEISDGEEEHNTVHDVTFSIPDLSTWFSEESPADQHKFCVTVALDSQTAVRLIQDNSFDLTRDANDASLGDEVSFFPNFADLSKSKTRRSTIPRAQVVYKFSCTIRDLFTAAPTFDWERDAETNLTGLSATLERFASVHMKAANRQPMSVRMKVAMLPRFMGRHGLDLELFISENKILTTPFRRSEGAMTLTLGKKPVQADPPQGASIRIGQRLPENSISAAQPFFQIRRWQFSVSSIAPYSRDVLPIDLLSSIDEDELSDYLEQPILIPLGDSNATASKADNSKMVLEVNETCEPPRVRNLRMEVKRVDPQDASQIFGNTSFLVLDRTPFMVALLQLPSLAKNDATNSSVVARRVIDLESGQPQWELAVDTTDPERAITVTLPPQAVGEEALVVDNIAEGAFAEYRFGAATILQLEPSYNPQRYVPVPWNLRRLFGYPGQRDPGAQVKRMQFELLYGLTANFLAKDAEKIVRIAELFARLGSLPGGLPLDLPWSLDGGAKDYYEKAWNALRRSWRSWVRQHALRLGVLEPWSPSQAQALVLDKGLDIVPRVAIGQKKRQPVGAQLKLPSQFDGKLPDEINNLHAKDGLGGGFHWGMQEWEAPFYRLFWDNRKSSSAEVRDLGFSALGGWGHQSARFANNRILIQSRTAMGRTHVYTVERIGKIAVFGHKAKHVYRYERSVVPSPYGADWGQTRHAGRPVLRKVEEYIELIEDRKDYPDHADGLPLDTGPIRACYFPGKGYRIPIRGSWGTAKDRLGVNGLDWEVPLWRKNAQPELYPKPTIFIEMLTGEGDQARPVAQTIANPQDVYFFTTAQEGLTDDVSKWPNIEGTDYLNSYEPTEWDKSESYPEQDVVPDDGWPEAVAIPPGYERFTFQLDRAEDEVNLVSNRREDAMLHGKMKNVTMMRCAPVAQPKVDVKTDAIKNAIALRQWQHRVNLGLGEVRKVLTSDPRNAKARLPAAWAAANARFPKLAAMPPKSSPKLDSAHNRTTCPASKSNPILKRAIESAIDEIVNNLWRRGRQLVDTVFKPIEDQLHSAAEGVASLKDELEYRLEEVQKSLNHVVFYVEFGPELLLDAFDRSLEHYLSSATEHIDQLTEFLGSELENLAVRAQDFLGENAAVLEDALETLKNRSNEVCVRATTSINGAITIIGTLPESMPWRDLREDIKLLLKKAHDRIIPPTDAPQDQVNLRAELEKLIEDAKKDVNALAQGPPAGLSAKIRELATAVDLQSSDARHLLDSLAIDIERIVRSGVETGEGSLATLKATIASFLKKPDNAAECKKKLAAEELPENVYCEIKRLKTQLQNFGENTSDLVVKFGQNVAEAKRRLEGTDENNPESTSLLGHIVIDAQNELTNLLCPLAELAFPLPDIVNDGLNALEDFEAIRDGWDKLQNIHYDDPKEWPKALDELDAIERRLGIEATWMGREIMPAIRDALPVGEAGANVVQEASNVLRSVRTLCNDLRTDGIGLNRKTVAMILNYKSPKIDLTPTLTRLNQFGKQLGALGLRLPTTELTDRFLPDKNWLPNFDFGNILSDIGGARLTNMLKRLKMPAFASDTIKVTQGLDKRTQRAWVLADVAVPLTKRSSLFDFGPVTVALENANFSAHIRADVDIDGPINKDARGEVLADWILLTGSQELVAFEKTHLTFVNGKMNFDLNPKNVRMGGLLKIISDLTSTLSVPGLGGGDDSPLKVALLKEKVLGLDLPAGYGPP